MASPDNQTPKNIDFEKLEKDIDEAINIRFFDFLIKKIQWLFGFLIKKSQLVFKYLINKSTKVFGFKTKEEYKYMQKYAEFKVSYYTAWFSIAIFAIALGLSYYITFYYTNIYTSNFGLFIAWIFAIILILYIIPKYITYCSIALDAEKRLLLLSMSESEPRQTQEIPMKQEKVELLTENRKRKTEIKESKKEFWDGMIGIVILFFTVYTFTRDYFEVRDRVSAITALYWAIFFVVFLSLLIYLAFKFSSQRRSI